jgi:hypothetical protein
MTKRHAREAMHLRAAFALRAWMVNAKSQPHCSKNKCLFVRKIDCIPAI